MQTPSHRSVLCIENQCMWKRIEETMRKIHYCTRMFHIAFLNTASSVRVVEVAEAACRDGVGEHVEEPAGLIPLHDARRREPRQHKPVCVRA